MVFKSVRALPAELRTLIGTFVPDPYLARLLLLSTIDNACRRSRAGGVGWDGYSIDFNIYNHRSMVLLNAARYNAFRDGINQNKISTRTHSMHWDLLDVIHQRTHICEALEEVWRPKRAYNLRSIT